MHLNLFINIYLSILTLLLKIKYIYYLCANGGEVSETHKLAYITPP